MDSPGDLEGYLITRTKRTSKISTISLILNYIRSESALRGLLQNLRKEY